MKEPTVKSRRQGETLRLTLSRPRRRNAFNDDMMAALLEEAGRAARDDRIRVVLLDGEGPCFCAGADIDWMRRLGEGGEEENRASAERMASLFRALDELPVPLVGRIHGACIGGAVGLAAVCDVVVAERGCFFSTSEVRLGILPAVIAPHVLRKVNPGRCRELMLTGRRFSAAEAHAMGLVHHVTGADDLDARVSSVTGDILLGGPRAQAHIKGFLRELESGGRSGPELDAWTAGEIARARGSEEGRQGLQAFLDRTTPPWVKE